MLQTGKSDVKFPPVAVKSRLPYPLNQPWPMGDILPKDPGCLPRIHSAKLTTAVEAAFHPREGFLYGGICDGGERTPIAERYGDGLGV